MFWKKSLTTLQPVLLNSEWQETEKKPQFFCFPLFPLPSFGHAFTQFNENFLESSALAYLDSQGSYTLSVGSSACATVIPGWKTPPVAQKQCHRFTCCKSGEVKKKKKRQWYLQYVQREKIYAMLQIWDFTMV